jgi:hypothetical protein
MAIAEALKGVGFALSDVTQHSFYGWAFEIVLPKRTAWCLLQGGDPWLLLVEVRKRGLTGLFGSVVRNEVDSVLWAIDVALKGDTRFSSIRWFTKQEYESRCQGGADSPM